MRRLLGEVHVHLRVPIIPDLGLDREAHPAQEGAAGQAVLKVLVVAVIIAVGVVERAVVEIRRGIDAGWRALWWFYFDHYNVFESLRNEPEFQAMRAEVAADLAAQLARVRELEASGEIPAPEAIKTGR